MSWACKDKPQRAEQLAAVYRVNPIGSQYTAGLPADVAFHLQQVAWEISQAFEAKEGRGSAGR